MFQAGSICSEVSFQSLINLGVKCAGTDLSSLSLIIIAIACFYSTPAIVFGDLVGRAGAHPLTHSTPRVVLVVIATLDIALPHLDIAQRFLCSYIITSVCDKGISSI